MAIAVIFGIGGVISSSVQKTADKTAAEADRKEAKIERDKLTDQIGDLIKQQQLSTTKEDILQGQVNTLTAKSMPELLGGMKQIANPKSGPKPDVTLRFVYPSDPVLLIVNQSDAIAREMKYMVVMWNMDRPDQNDPLPIPVATFDWLKPHGEGGPENLFDAPGVKALLKPGDHLLGSAAVMCPECPRGRTFLVSIVWGTGGWFSELSDAKTGTVAIPVRNTKENRETYFKLIEAIPEKLRIPISDYPVTPLSR